MSTYVACRDPPLCTSLRGKRDLHHRTFRWMDICQHMSHAVKSTAPPLPAPPLRWLGICRHMLHVDDICRHRYFMLTLNICRLMSTYVDICDLPFPTVLGSGEGRVSAFSSAADLGTQSQKIMMMMRWRRVMMRNSTPVCASQVSPTTSPWSAAWGPAGRVPSVVMNINHTIFCCCCFRTLIVQHYFWPQAFCEIRLGTRY